MDCKKKCKMRVNFVSTALFTHLLVVKSSIAIVMLFCLSEASVSAPRYIETRVDTTRGTRAEAMLALEHSDRALMAKHVNLVIRHIGHRLLLQSGDFTSRVLPVTEIKAGTFQLRFENEFVFNHDSLMALSQGLLPKTQFTSGYTVTVHDCVKGEIVYGFQLNNTARDILACRGRSQPSGCYTIEFAFPDFYENVEQKEASLTAEVKSVNIDPQQGNSRLEKAEEPKSVTVERQKASPSVEGTEELKSLKVDLEEANPIPMAIGTEKLKTTTSDYPLVNVAFIAMLLLVGVSLLIGRFGKILKPVSVHNQNHGAIKESVPELAALGKFLFDVKDQRLLLGSEVIRLTDKECKILELLNKSFGELTLRETLMQKIWINEGVITGRSLDMFVSKLRKKLSSDPELRITNVHGKGYTLEILGI
jgi:hypothetical protein